MLCSGAIPRAAGAAAVEAYIWVPVTEQELGKSLMSFKGGSYLSLNPGIYLRRGKIKWFFFFLTEPLFSIIYHLCFGLHKDRILIQVMKHDLIGDTGTDTMFNGLRSLNETRAGMTSVNALKIYIPEMYKVFLPHSLIFHSIILLCWSPMTCMFPYFM